MSTSPAAEFRRLHADGILVLANVWDAMSARLVASLGARASRPRAPALAWSNGYPDGDRLPVPLLVGAVERIARVVDGPAHVDCEGGYAASPPRCDASRGRRRGCVGINLEDGFDPTDVLAAKIAAVRAPGPTDVFVNARTDVYLKSLSRPSGASRRRCAAPRSTAPRAPTALFVPGVSTARRSARSRAAPACPSTCSFAPACRMRPSWPRSASAGPWFCHDVPVTTTSREAPGLA